MCFSLNAQTITFNEVQLDGVGGVDGLNGTYGVVVSPDNKHVYSASSTDDAVAVFSRNESTGDLTFVEMQLDDSKVGGTIDGLLDAKRLTISVDGKHIYVPTTGDDAVVVFSRNSTTGALTYVETQKDGIGGVDGLNGAFQAVVSSDDKHVYVVGSTDDAIAVFSRNSTTGALTYVEMQKDGVGGVDGLNSARSIMISPDDKHVYVAGSIDDAVAVFSRNSTTGALTYVEMQQDGVGGVDGLNGAYGVFVTPDNAHVYCASSSDDAVAVFSRNTTTGALTYVEVLKDDSQGGVVTNLNAARFVSGTADGAYILAVSSSDDGLVVFSRNTTTGVLTVDEEYKDNIAGVDGLDGARFLAITSGDENVYIGSSTDDAISTFDFSAAPLPIELVNFEVEPMDETAIISWTTATEIDNDYFVIERSEDGYTFEPVETVLGAGNSNATLSYKLVDEQPLKGTSYYRLKQVDFDGHYTYSDLRDFYFTEEESECELTVFPQPCSDQCNINIGSCGVQNDAPYQVSIYNMQGEQVFSKQGSVTKDQTFTKSVSTNNLTSGMYVLVVSLSDKNYATKLMVR
jgi:6-phosphogluconolactonase (cycloisomerase 2 family)